MRDTLEYPYRANPWTMFLAIAFFGACAAMMVRTAITNDQGLIINGIITLGIAGATRFYWGMAAVSALFVAAGAAGMVSGRATPRFVRLTPTEISAPKHGFARQPTVVRLDQVQNVDLMEIKRQRIMTIYHRGGSLSIAQSMLPGRAAFDELHGALIARLQRGAAPEALRG